MDRKTVEKVKSYANIAIIKYWGKENAEKMIPSTSSISLTLENMFTETEISFVSDEESKEILSKVGENESGDLFYLNGELQNKEQRDKISKVVDLFRDNREKKVKISTVNNMPTEAGLSSSSSGLSATVLACNKLFKTNYTKKELSKIAKYA